MGVRWTHLGGRGSQGPSSTRLRGGLNVSAQDGSAVGAYVAAPSRLATITAAFATSTWDCGAVQIATPLILGSRDLLGCPIGLGLLVAVIADNRSQQGTGTRADKR